VATESAHVKKSQTDHHQPLCRTVETAELVIETLKLPFKAELREELAPGGNALGLVEELLRERPSASCWSVTSLTFRS